MRIHSPRCYGVEIETNTRTFGDWGKYNASVPKQIIRDVGTDPTVRGWEFRTHILKGDILVQYWDQFYNVIKRDDTDEKAPNAGTHVHIDCRDFFKDREPKVGKILNLMMLGAKYDKWLMAASPTYRVSQRCYSFSRVQPDEVLYIYNNPKCRYRTDLSLFRSFVCGGGRVAFNTSSLYSSKRTTEFRHMESTKDINMLVPWVKICQAMVDTAMRTNLRDSYRWLDNFETMVEVLQLDEECVDWLRERINKYGPPTPQIVRFYDSHSTPIRKEVLPKNKVVNIYAYT